MDVSPTAAAFAGFGHDTAWPIPFHRVRLGRGSGTINPNELVPLPY